MIPMPARMLTGTVPEGSNKARGDGLPGLAGALLDLDDLSTDLKLG